MDSKIIVKEPCAQCVAGTKSAVVDNSKALEIINKFKASTSTIEAVVANAKTAKENHSSKFLKAMHTVIVTQDASSNNLVGSITTQCDKCGGDGFVERTFNMAEAFTAMLSSALQDPDFATKNAELLKKLTSGSGTSGSST